MRNQISPQPPLESRPVPPESPPGHIDQVEAEVAAVQPKPSYDDYELLVAHRRTDRSLKTQEQLHSEYVQLTDGLIYDMTHGMPFTDPTTGERIVKQPDAVVFLDKSARPLSWLTRSLWETLARDENGDVPKMPDMYFANIDREQWVNTVDQEGTGAVDIDAVSPTIIRNLRSIYVSPKDKREGLTESIDTAEAALDGKAVLIIDEVMSSGRTLRIAQGLYQRAFPTAQVAGTYWMAGKVRKGFAEGNADLPVWYKKDTPKGRGVNDRNPHLSQRSPSLTQRLGGWFLSTPYVEAYQHEDGTPVEQEPLWDRDPAAWRLRHELGRLAADARSGKVLVIPSLKRELDEADAMALRLNPEFEKIEDFYAASRALRDRGQQSR